MTRKSKREIERDVEELAEEHGERLGWIEAMRWLQHVEAHGAGAASPAEFFGTGATWADGFRELLDEVTADDPALQDLNPAEVAGLRYCRESIGAAVIERRRALRGGDPTDD